VIEARCAYVPLEALAPAAETDLLHDRGLTPAGGLDRERALVASTCRPPDLGRAPRLLHLPSSRPTSEGVNPHPAFVSSLLKSRVQRAASRGQERDVFCATTNDRFRQIAALELFSPARLARAYRSPFAEKRGARCYESLGADALIRCGRDLHAHATPSRGRLLNQSGWAGRRTLTPRIAGVKLSSRPRSSLVRSLSRTKRVVNA